MSTEVGEITYLENGYVKWNIKNFQNIWEIVDWFKSPSFTFFGRKCYIALLPHFTEAWLHFKSSSPFCQNLYIDIQLRSGNSVANTIHSHLHPGSLKTVVHIDFTKFLTKETQTPQHDYLTVLFWVFKPDGSNIYPDEWIRQAHPANEKASEIEISYKKKKKSKPRRFNAQFSPGRKTGQAHSASEKTSEIEISYEEKMKSKPFKKLLEDLKSLLVSGENSDVKLVVRGKEFLAHRLILCSRSPVFKAMLCHDTSEKDSGIVNIEDCNPDSFQDFLDYVYTGSTENVNTENMINLYAYSDKYLMSELKDVCVSFMKANMSVESFCAIATVALLHAEEELLQVSKDFFFENSKNISESKNWETFFEENPKEAYEHFMKPLMSRR